MVRRFFRQKLGSVGVPGMSSFRGLESGIDFGAGHGLVSRRALAARQDLGEGPLALRSRRQGQAVSDWIQSLTNFTAEASAT